MATITDARVIVTSPGRNFVTLKITTSDGVTGLGDATLNGRELAVAGYLRDHVVPLLIGRDPARIEDTWQYLYKGAYWRRGPVTMTAIAAVDTALWDIKGKVAGLPLYELLGGKAREGAMVYGHASGGDVAELLDDIARFRDLGYQAIRAQAAVPGTPGSYGVRHGRGVYEPANASLPDEQMWSTEAYLDFAPGYLAAVRERFGFHFHLLHDVHHRLTPTEAGRLGRRLEDLRLFWMEDPTPAELQESFRQIRQATTTPIAVGEVFNSIWDCQQLITERLIDYIRVSVVHAAWHHPRPPDLQPGRAVPGAHRLARRHRPVARQHGGGRAPGRDRPQLRRPGVHGARTGHPRGVPPHVRAARRRPPPLHGAGPGRGDGRGGRRPLPVRAEVSAGQPQGRRFGARLVSTTDRLSRATLSRVPEPSRPAVDPASLRPRLVHLGIGAFHRAHQAVYTEAAEAAHGGGWGIAGVTQRSRTVVDRLRPQDGLYSLARREPGGPAVQVVGSVVEVLHAVDDGHRLAALLASPDVAVVTITVTEKGYRWDPATGGLAVGDPLVRADLAGRPRLPPW